MPKRSQDADTRRFFDEFEWVNVSRFRATGVIDPAKRHALIPFPNGKTKLIGTQHVKFWNGGGYSYFVCPGCSSRARKLWLLDDAPRCIRCCTAMNIRHASKYGFGRQARRHADDKILDELIAKVETQTPLKLKPPKTHKGRAQFVYNSRKLTHRMRRDLVSLRLQQLASQQASDSNDRRQTYKLLADTRHAIDIRPIQQAKTREDLEQALDKAQQQIIAALESDDPTIRTSAARLMLRTKQARDRGIV